MEQKIIKDEIKGKLTFLHFFGHGKKLLPALSHNMGQVLGRKIIKTVSRAKSVCVCVSVGARVLTLVLPGGERSGSSCI